MELQTKERLSRWSREGDKAVVLTPRDIEIFKLLARYRFLRADFIAALLGANPKKISQRLNLLCRDPNRYVDRPEEHRQYINSNYRYLIYQLSKRGKDFLHERGVELEHYRLGSNKNFAHSMMQNDALSSLELGMRESARLISWREITESPRFPAHGSTVIPVNVGFKFKTGKTQHLRFDYTNDGLFAVEYPNGGGYRTFQLEAEHGNRVWCNNLDQTSFLKKFVAIRDIMERRLYRDHWGVSNLHTLVLCNNAEHIETMKRLVEQLDPAKRISPFILFREIAAMEDLRPARPMPDLWGVWQRAGLPDFDISQP